MQNVQIYEVEEHDGRQYVTTTARGVQYTLAQQPGGWFVYSRRLGLGRTHIGGGKHYDTLADVATGCKAFADFFAMDPA